MAKRRITPATPVNEIHLGGKTFKVVYDFNALALFFEITGVNLLHGWPAEKFSPKEVHNFVFAGVQAHHPDCDYKWLGSQLNLGNFESVLLSLKTALKDSMPEKTDTPTEPTDEGNA